MTARAIVRTPDTCNGRFRLAGTRLTVAFFKRNDPEDILANWDYVTREEIEAARAFEVPAVHAIAVPRVYPSDITGRCRCGDDLEIDGRRLRCWACGRVYRLTMRLTEITP